MASDKQKAMNKVQKYAFTLTEAKLFLDSHPQCAEAISYYEKQVALYKEAVKEYEDCYSPLTAEAGVKDGKWLWATTPWPWERSEN